MRFSLLIILLSVNFYSFCQNYTDANGLKQGNWAYETIDTLRYRQVSFDSDDEEIVEYKKYNSLEGEYLDDKKHGVWICRDAYNHVLSTVTFNMGKLEGPVKVFYRSGAIRYKGDVQPDSEFVELETKAEGGKFWATKKMKVSELLEKWTFIK